MLTIWCKSTQKCSKHTPNTRGGENSTIAQIAEVDYDDERSHTCLQGCRRWQHCLRGTPICQPLQVARVENDGAAGEDGEEHEMLCIAGGKAEPRHAASG